MEIREFGWDDYPAVCDLWGRLQMLKPSIDSREALAGCLGRNPGLFLVGTAPEQGGRIVATAVGTFDGRRGYLYHVAVDPACRRQGYGRAIVGAVLRRLWDLGAAKVSLRVARGNGGAIAFYRDLGLQADEHVLAMSVERTD